MRKLKLFFACLLMAVLSIGQVWGENYNETISVSDVGDMLSGSYTSASGYWKVPATAGNNGTITIPSTYFANQPTSDVTLTLHLATFGSGNNPAKATVTITAIGAETGTTWTTSSYTGTLPSSSSYTDITLTLSKPTNPTTLGGVIITLGVNTGVKIFRLQTIGVAYKYSAAACSQSISIAKSSTTPEHGSFELSNSGDQICIDSENASTTVTATPDEHYHLASVSSTVGTIGTISGNTCEITDIDDDTEISVTFEEDNDYTVTWNNHGIETTSQVYEGEKPVFPATPISCDATSTTFIGWATAAWDGKLPNLDDKTVYTSASAMPEVAGPVEYFAVYAKVGGTTGWVLTDIADLTAEDVFVLADASNYALNNDGGASAAPSTNAITVSAGKITSAVAENLKWNISGNATDGYTFYPNGSTTTWLYCNTTAASSSNNNMRVGTGDRKVFVFDNAGVLVTDDSNVDRYLCRYQTQDFRGYINKTTANTTPVVPKFYKYSAGTTSDYMTTCAAAGTCEAPSFSPAEGTFDAAQDITLVTSTPSATIYYTLDGTDPDDGSDEYTAAIHITQNTKIKAITYADGLTESSISEGVFNIRYAQPTFSLTAGAYSTAQNVTITATGADAIYYTTNGDDPTVAPANLYNGSEIALNTAGTHTIKAIAVKAGYANSSVASAVYEMNLPYGSIAEFIAGAPTAAAKDLVLETADNCIITGINGTTIYAQDASGKGIMIYGLSELPTNAAVNHQITGTINAKYQLFKHQHEMTNVDFSGATISADPVSRPAVSEYTTLAAAYAAKPMMLVKLTGVKYEGVDSYYNATFGSSKIYNTFNVFNASTVWPEDDVDCDITGIVIDYNGTYELLPIFASDVVADADAAAPVFTPAGGADEAHAVQVDLNSDVTIAAADANHTVDITSAKITTTTAMSVTATSSRHFYRPTTVTKWYYGNAAAAAYDILGTGTDANGNEVAATVGGSAATTAVVGATVTVTIDVAEHFHFASIQVNNGVVSVTEVTAGEEYTFEMPEGNATIAVTYTEDAKATLTFAKGDADGTQDAPANIVDYVGETVQLPANPFTYNGYKFIGWSCDGGTTKLAAGADYELAENKAFVAYWAAIPTFNDADHEWRLATSLEAGKYYVIGSASQDKTASKTITSGYMSEIDSEIEDGVIAYDALGANTAIFILGGNSTDGWTLTEVTTDDVLGTTANKNVSWNAGTQVWAISIAEGGNATIGGTSRILHNAANTGKRFTTYTSDLTASMLLPQLYVWTEKTFKLRYDANEGTNAPTATPAVAGKAVVTDAVPTAPTGKIFDGWNENAAGTGASYVAGDEISVTDADVTIYAKWRDPVDYTVSYNANGGTLMEGKSDIANATVTEGNLVTVAANVYEKEGFVFGGWKLGENIYMAGQKFTMPAENVELVAQWASLTVTDFVLVTDVKQLKDGDKVYIVAADYDRAMSTQNSGKYREYVEIHKSADGSHVVLISADPVEFTLGKSGDYFTFYDGEGYLYASSSSKNYLETQTTLTDDGKWEITISEGVASIVAQGTSTNNKLKWNNGSPRFSCYGSGQQPVAIYKRPDYSRDVNAGRYGTICLPKAGKMEGAALFEVAYFDASAKKIFFDEVLNGEMVAGMPYIFLPNEGASKLGVYYSDNTVADASAGNYHGLFGSYDKTLLTPNEGNYILYNNQYLLVNSDYVYVGENRAYIKIGVDGGVPTNAVAPAPGRRRVAMGVLNEQVVTGVDELNAAEAPVKVLINGQMFILRGEKMYDTTGRLVK